MSKVTSKFQVSIPRVLAERVGIRVGDDLVWEEAGGTLRARIPQAAKSSLPVRERLRLFDAATARQAERERGRGRARVRRRGWTRDELYVR